MEGTSSDNINTGGRELLSEYAALGAKRRDVIIELLKELLRTGVTRINFVDLIVDYIASNEFRYSMRNEIIKKLFIGEEMLTDHEMEDYAILRTLEKLYQHRRQRQDLKSRIDNLKY
jgi:hypothetical protein